MGQEEIDGIEFDFKSEQLGLDWQSSIVLLVAACALWVFWRGVSRFTERRLDLFQQTGFQLLAPIVILGCDALVVGVGNLVSGTSNAIVEGVVAVLGVGLAIINLPAIVTFVPIAYVLDRLPQVAHLPAALLGAWAAWYAVIRLLAMRASLNNPVALTLRYYPPQ